jgi:anti-sigma factor RsiW
MGRARHLVEERLFDCYVAERAGESIEPPAADHLADCGECAARYAELAQFMDGLRADADADTDALFPAEWRDAQRQQIARRIEHLGHAARIISFPGRLVARHMAGTASRMAPRWAAAAAAGLFVGIGVGMFYDARSHVAQTAQTISGVPAAARPAQTAPTGLPVSVQAPAFDTDAFLSELESALGGPRTPELMSLDVLTPQVREVVLNSR